jgi:hypothetical protein
MMLRMVLIFKPGIVITNVPYQLDDRSARSEGQDSP